MTYSQLPLSALQEAMWVAWQVDPEASSHVIPLTFTVTGDLDVARLRHSVEQVCRRHPTLLARIDGQVLTWADAPPVPFACRPYREDALRRAQTRPFDLARGPLIRVEVIGDATVVLAVHHLTLDGASVPVLFDDLMRAYRGESLGEPLDPAPMTAHARRSWELATGASGEPLRRFWRESLAGDVAARPLPTYTYDEPYRPVIRPIPGELVESARRVAGELDVTYFTMVFGALYAVLRHHTGADDLIVSTAYHGRSDPALAGYVSSFVNLLPIRQRLDGSRSYRALLASLRADVRTAVEHGDLPLPAILRSADLVGPAGRLRTHEVALSYRDMTWGASTDVRRLEFVHDGARAELALQAFPSVSHHRLTVHLHKDRDGSQMVWHNPGRDMDPELIAALARDHLAVVADMVAEPDRTLADGLALLPPPPAARRSVVVSASSQRPVGSASAEIVAALARIWREMLRVPVTAEDSFFELGGQSLTATTMVARIAEQLDVELSVRDLFTHPVLGELAAVLEQRPASRKSAGGRPSGDVFPATRFQEGIWLAERLDPTNSRYHVPLFWDVSGQLAAARLRSALALLVARHEILRTRFLNRDGRLYQEVLPPWEPEVGLSDLSGLSEEDRKAWLTAWSDEAAHRLDLERGRLLTAGLFTVAEDRQVFALCAHHLVVDGESVRILVRELERCDGAATEVPAAQYRDLVAAEEPDAEGLALWVRRLAGAPSSLGLPRPAEPASHGGVVLSLSAGTAAALLPVRLSHQVSPFMIEVAAVAAVLHRWTGLDDITFGVPVAQRGSADEIIGPCLNTLVLRSRCTADATLGELLRRLRAEIIDAFEHQDVPFEDIVRALRPPRAGGGPPYVDVLINNVGQTHWSFRLGDAHFTPAASVAAGAETSKFALTVTFTESAGSLRGAVTYRGDLVDPLLATDAAAGIAEVLNRFPDLLDVPLSELPVGRVRA